MEVTIWQTLITQAPGTAAVIMVVVLFLRAIEKRDTLFVEQIQKLADTVRGAVDEMKEIKELVIEHDTRVSEGMNAMYREVSRRKKAPAKAGD